MKLFKARIYETYENGGKKNGLQLHELSSTASLQPEGAPMARGREILCKNIDDWFYILIIKANKMHYFSTLFWQRTLYRSFVTTVTQLKMCDISGETFNP